MARPRLQLQTILKAIPGPLQVYFQPPANLQMEYPCIVYARDGEQSNYANNHLYQDTYRYTVTVISRDPENVIGAKVAQLPLCKFNRTFPADNLYHDVYTLYF